MFFQHERLVIVIDVAGNPGKGKTAALGAVVREIVELVGPGVPMILHGEIGERSSWPPVDFDRNDIDMRVEVFHRG